MLRPILAVAVSLYFTQAVAAPVENNEPPSLTVTQGRLAYSAPNLSQVQIGVSRFEEAKKKQEIDRVTAIETAQNSVFLNDKSKVDTYIIAESIVRKTWPSEDEWQAFAWIVQMESGWQPTVRESHTGACGLMQFNPCSKLKSFDIENQIKQGVEYIKDRYGSPSKAKEFHLKSGWY